MLNRCEECNKEFEEKPYNLVFTHPKEKQINIKFHSIECKCRWIIKNYKILWVVENFPLSFPSKEEIKNTMVTRIGSQNFQNCHACKNIGIDCCSRCEKSICAEHSIPTNIILRYDGKGLMGANYCKECILLAMNISEAANYIEKIEKSKRGV